MKILLALLLLCVAAFSAFGFLAAGEPMDDGSHLTWRIGYGIAIIASLYGVVRLFRREGADAPGDGGLAGAQESVADALHEGVSKVTGTTQAEPELSGPATDGEDEDEPVDEDSEVKA